MNLPSEDLRLLEIAQLEERIHNLEYDVKDAEWTLKESTDARCRQQAANVIKAALQDMRLYAVKLRELNAKRG